MLPAASTSTPPQAAHAWSRLGRRAEADEFLQRALGYSRRLEELVEGDGTRVLPVAERERCAVQLFDLYLSAARSVQVTGRQQASICAYVCMCGGDMLSNGCRGG